MGQRIIKSLKCIGAGVLMLISSLAVAQSAEDDEQQLPKIEETPIFAPGDEPYRLSQDKLEKLRQLENQTPGRLFEFRTKPAPQEAAPNRPRENPRRRL